MTLVQKLQAIKEAKDEMVKALSASYGVSATLSDVVQNVKKATKTVEDLSSITDADLYEYCIEFFKKFNIIKENVGILYQMEI